MDDPTDVEQLRAEIEELRSQLGEAKDALRAIRAGEVDALVVQTHEGDQVFALESAYEPYRVFLENIREGAVALAANGLILYANPRLADLTGVPHSRLLGTSIYQLFGDANRPLLENMLGDVAIGPREAEIVLTTGDGRTVHTYFSVTVMPDGTRCAVVTDLTDRVRLRETLASHELLQVTLSSIGDAVLCCDVEGRVTFLNPVAEELTGWSEREAQGQPIQRVFRTVGEITHEPAEDIVSRVLRDGTIATLANDTALVTRDSREVSIEDSAAPIRDAAGKLVGAVLVFQDVSERRAARRALAEAQTRVKNVLNSITNGYYALDANWRFTAANPTAERHFGRPAGELLGENIWKIARTGPDTVQYQSFLRVMETRRAEHLEARSNLRCDYWAELHVYPRDDGIEVYFGDISQRKQAEASLERALVDLEAAKLSAERAKAAAEEANRAKDHFLAILSHELRTPLSPVLSGLSLIDADPTLSPRARGCIEVIRRNVELETRILDDLLDVTRVARGKILLTVETVDLWTVIAAAVEVCQADIDARRLHLSVDFGPQAGGVLVEGDPARLRQVFWNLLKNAIKFTPKDGCVGVRCRAGNGQVLVEVSDSGVGIDPAALSVVFDAFAQAEASHARQFGGLGLGLAICKSLVEMHRGTIEAHSEGPGKGATFRVRLPLLRVEPLWPPTGATPERARVPLPKRRILLVDDHGDTLEMLRMILEFEGHEVQTAGDCSTALEIAAQTEFDILLSDLGLPDRNGLDLMRELRARGSKLPGIALSGYGQQTDIAKSRAVGFSEHLVKPVDPQVLLKTIENVMRQADHG